MSNPPPEGLALRARLTMTFIENSMSLYRQVREDAGRKLSAARRNDVSVVQIVGEGDIADICRLTCLELGIQVIDDESVDTVPLVIVEGREINFIDNRTEETAVSEPGNPITQEV